jgi:hypothetical protein
MSASPSHVYQADMGFSHRELIKGLPSAVFPYTVNRVSSDTYSFTLENRIARLHLGPEISRKIASLKLPVTKIIIEFENFSALQYESFMERFKKYLHRGGG